MAREEDWQLVESFVHESEEMIRQVLPFVRALVAQPDREDIVHRVTGPGFRLFHSVKGTGAFLGLEHLVAPAEAMEYLLDRVRSGVLLMTPRRIALLAEACTFLEQGLPLVGEDKSDKRLAGSAAALTAAIRLAASPERESVVGEGAVAGLPADMREAFLWETENLLATAERECVLWDFIAIDPERVAELSRLLHRLKQSFALYDFQDPEQICLALASTLNRYVQGEYFQTEYPERVFLRCIDALRTTLTTFPLSNDLAVPDVEHHLAAIQGLMRQPIGELLIEAGLVAPEAVDLALKVQRSSRDEQPRRLGEVLVAMGEVTPEQVRHVLREQHDKRTRTQEAEAALGAKGPAGTNPSLAISASHAVTIDGRRLERMSAVLERLMAMPLPGEHVAPLAELQALVHSCRREAFASLVNRLQRVVHDLSVQSGKPVHFVVEGIEALQETGEAPVLVDSLLCLLRNGVEHGLETVAERMQSGKKKTGALHLLALHQGDEVWISIEDDGRGFDFERVASQIVRRGVLDANSVERLTGRERIQRLFEEPSVGRVEAPAAERRDPGLVAVQKTLQAIRGQINVTTRAGKGTCVTLRVPRRHRSVPEKI